MNHRLARVSQTDADTFGVFLNDDGTPCCLSLELPDKGNAPDVSCIPASNYIAVWTKTPKHPGGVYMLQGVPKRAAIEIHPANKASQLLGCIAVGEQFGVLGAEEAVYSSVDAYNAFLALHPQREPFSLLITDPLL